MGHKPAEAVTRNAVVNMTCVEEPALILIRHCQDMKKQETRLRFITLLLLLGCGSLFLYISCAVLWFHREPAGTEHTVSSCLLFCFLLRNASVSLSVAKRCSTFLEMMQNPTTQRRKLIFVCSCTKSANLGPHFDQLLVYLLLEQYISNSGAVTPGVGEWGECFGSVGFPPLLIQKTCMHCYEGVSRGQGRKMS